MSTDVLTLTQWLSPSYPVGAFAYSHGLEAAIAGGQITDAQSLRHWLKDVLRYGSGRSDCILLRAAYAADTDDKLAMIDASARAFAPSAERLQETLQQGQAFCATTDAIWGGQPPDLTYPVALGHAACRAGLDVTLTASMYLHAFASNLISATVRAVPLGQTEGQHVLAALTPVCHSIAEETAGLALDSLSGCAFLSDITAMRHETLQPRIFRT